MKMEHLPKVTYGKLSSDMEQQNQHQEHQQQQQHQERRYHSCNKGCGQLIYFDANSAYGFSESGKWILLSKDTEQPHQCQ
jgi:hypothetical protein